MAKAQTLGLDALSTPQITPKAATPARSPAAVPSKTAQREATKSAYVPLQVRVPPEDLRAIRVAAAQKDMKLNEFMLTCFRAYMQNGQAN